ncbi:hypothetical protein [Acetobacter orientalis]|uniref:hypothetical protein n=1 Tax=Acetobacter orientalis TaxID=146474 RepID=UPI000B9BC234|nr:hypothetical protein [Acetobacter orientalis]
MHSNTPPSLPAESLKRTAVKTVATVTLTVLLIVLMRGGLTALPWLDHVTGGQVGTSVLQFLAVDGVAQKQQWVAIALMLVCFAVAVGSVKLAERLLRRS